MLALRHSNLQGISNASTHSFGAEYVLQAVGIAHKRSAAVDESLVLVRRPQGERLSDPLLELPDGGGSRQSREQQRAADAYRRRHDLEIDDGLVRQCRVCPMGGVVE